MEKELNNLDDEMIESPFDKIGVENDFEWFPDYVDPRESEYLESFEFPEAMWKTNGTLNSSTTDSVYYDDLEEEYWDYDDPKDRMKKHYDDQEYDDSYDEGNHEGNDEGWKLSENMDDENVLNYDSVEDYDSSLD